MASWFTTPTATKTVVLTIGEQLGNSTAAYIKQRNADVEACAKVIYSEFERLARTAAAKSADPSFRCNISAIVKGLKTPLPITLTYTEEAQVGEVIAKQLKEQKVQFECIQCEEVDKDAQVKDGEEKPKTNQTRLAITWDVAVEKAPAKP
jgi:hypothetical protein